MKIYKTLMFFSDSDPGHIFACDTIESDGKFWLVPDWLDNIATKKRTPIRMICLDGIKHQRVAVGKPSDFVLNEPIPKCVFDGQAPQGTSFQIVENPLITDDIPKQSTFH